MKQYKYKVIYLNGNEETFTCNGFNSAIILGMAHAIHKAWDYRIKYITDEKGVQIKDIEFPTYNYSS